MATRKHSFLVDVGKTMIDTNRISSEGKDNQRLYCKCGASKELKSKARRLVVKKHDTTVEDKHSVESIKCDKCGYIYNQENRVFLLVPDEDELYKITFKTEEKDNIVTLFREKTFARYETASDKLNDSIIRTDYIKFDKKSKSTTIFLSKPTLDKNMTQQKQGDVNDVTEEVGLSKIGRLEHFFMFYDFAVYNGLINIFTFFNKIDEVVADLNQIKKMVSPINYTYNNPTFEKIDEKTGEAVTYIDEDKGFGDGTRDKHELKNIGGFLARFVELSKFFLCVADFPSITTILLTKGAHFFKDFIHSKSVLNSVVYKKLEATSPTRIMEVSMNYDVNGILRAAGDQEKRSTTAKKVVSKEDNVDENPNYLRVSPLIYKNITTPPDMELLLSVYRKKYVTKTDIETLFQNYEPSRIYKFYRNLDKQRVDDNIRFTLKNIKHILDRNLDDVPKGQSADYLHWYIDTLRTMDLLELPDGYVYKIKSNKELKETHDDLAARYGAIKDAKKAEFYKKATKEIEKINTVIGDVKLQVVPTLEDLNKEGMMMGHCVYTYLDRVVNKNYVAVHVQHILSNERATLGLMRNGSNLEFDQLKGYQNSRASRELIEAVIEFMDVNKIKNSSSRNGDLSPSPGSQKRMHDYLSNEEVEELRKKRALKEKAEMEKAQAEGREYTPKYTEDGSVKRRKGLFGNLFS